MAPLPTSRNGVILMDEDEELRKLKWLLIGGLVFLVSGWFAFGEMRYALFGSTVQARIVDVSDTELVGRRGRRTPMRAIRYSFEESDGAQRTERDDVPLDWTPAEGETLTAGSTVSVQYLSGKPDKSRLAGHKHSLPLAIFVVCLLGMLGFSVWLWRHAHEAVHGNPYRRRR